MTSCSFKLSNRLLIHAGLRPPESDGSDAKFLVKDGLPPQVVFRFCFSNMSEGVIIRCYGMLQKNKTLSLLGRVVCIMFYRCFRCLVLIIGMEGGPYLASMWLGGNTGLNV